MRDGFLSGLDADTAQHGHEAARTGLTAALGDAPGENPSDPATLDLLEEIVHHTLQSGHVPEAWDIYLNRIGGVRNLGWRLGAYERGERMCRAFAGGESPETVARLFESRDHDSGGRGSRRAASDGTTIGSAGASPSHYLLLTEGEQAIFINEWAMYLGDLGRLAAAARCYELDAEMAMRQENWTHASIYNQNLCGVWLLSGRLTGSAGKGGLSTAAEALRLAERADDAEVRFKSHAYCAYARASRGEIPAALADFRAAVDWQHKVEPHAADRPLWGWFGVYHTYILSRLGRVEEATRLTKANKEFCLKELGEDDVVKPLCNLVLSDLPGESLDRSVRESLCRSARDWAVARDAKEVLCWSALVQARLELAAALRPERAKHDSPGHRPGSSKHENPQALKGRHKEEPSDLSRPFRAPDDHGESGSQGDALGYHVADPSGLKNANASITDGLKIARDCGYGIFHIDLLLERARLHLLRGNPQSALDDLHVALGDSSGAGGIPANDETGQPELLAANHEECGYVWAIPFGLQLRAEALLLQAAQTLGQDSFVPAKISELPADFIALIDQAKQHLHDALDRWHDLRDPEPTEDNNFQLDGKEYNHRAADTHRIVQELVRGMLTHYLITPTKLSGPRDKDAVDINQEEEAEMSNFDIFLSHNSKDKPDVRRLGEALKKRGLSVWLDEWELAPGSSWIDELENIVTTCGSSAVCVGKNGLGPWEEPEMQALLIRFMKEKKTGNAAPVIPVLLPGAPDDVKLPVFLQTLTWLDLRDGLKKEGLDRLQWGITGVKPNP